MCAGTAFPVASLTLTGDCNHSKIRGVRLERNVMEKAMHGSCLNCTFRADRLFCDMPGDALQAFDAIKTEEVLAKGTALFVEGRPARGIHILCDGRAKLSITSETGKRLMLRVAGPGEVLGLGATVSATPYEVTAELLDTSQVVFVKRKDLLKFLRDYRESCMMVVQMLSGDLHTAYERVRSIGLTRARRPRITRLRSVAS